MVDRGNSLGAPIVVRFIFLMAGARMVRKDFSERKASGLPVEDLRQSPMMGHLLDRGDIGHYGRLIFAMIGGRFVGDDEIVKLLTKDHDADARETRAMVQKVQEKRYSPPRRE